MMDWTDRHCRYFLRGLSPGVLLYTEMITAAAILRGDSQRLLRFDVEEHPVALQLGGSSPADLARAAAVGAEFGYDEINLNCGCPSDRVRRGTFGACLMSEPELVADCVQAMRDAVPLPVTVKLRIGTVGSDEPDLHRRVSAFDARDQDSLYRFVAAVQAAGAAAIIVHARKAVLGGWSPRDNREVPPLRHDLVAALRGQFPTLPVVLNGGLRDVAAVQAALGSFDGVMLGREAYHRPGLLAELGQVVLGEPDAPSLPQQLERMAQYAARELQRGERLPSITRHMLGLLSHAPRAREFRRLLSEGAREADAGPDLLRRAIALVA